MSIRGRRKLPLSTGCHHMKDPLLASPAARECGIGAITAVRLKFSQFLTSLSDSACYAAVSCQDRAEPWTVLGERGYV